MQSRRNGKGYVSKKKTREIAVLCRSAALIDGVQLYLKYSGMLLRKIEITDISGIFYTFYLDAQNSTGFVHALFQQCCE